MCLTRRLHANRTTPRCEHGFLVLPDMGSAPIAVGSQEWYAWLNSAERRTFYFADGIHGCTVRCEQRRGGHYWYAFAHRGGRLQKRYLGRSVELCVERLRSIVQDLHTAPQALAHQALIKPAIGSDDLLITKLKLPPPQARLLLRPRLHARLDAALTTKLTLLQAPAGYGKTSLLLAWLATQPKVRVAWFAIDSADNDPIRFWRSLLAAIAYAQAGVADEAQALLSARSPIEAVLTSLINWLAGTSAVYVLALDDYHLIETDLIHVAMAFLLEHAPHNMHIVIASRHQVALSLSRLRGRAQLNQLFASDLRLTLAEASRFFSNVLGLEIAQEQLKSLVRASEGWFVGIQLAALSYSRNPDRHAVDIIAGIATLDYLAEEVFAKLPLEIQSFLLDTAILDRLCSALCDAVWTNGAETSTSLLRQIEQANLFLVPLDSQQHWFRYHHLFANFLRYRLERSHPQRIAGLHSRAASWFAEQSMLPEAIQHALNADNQSYAALLIMSAAETMIRQGEVLTLHSWIEALAQELVRQSAWLSLWYAWTLALTMQHAQAELWLIQVEQQTYPNAGDSEASALLGQVEVIRATICANLADLKGTIDHAQAALTMLPLRHTVLRAVLALNLGTAYVAAGDLLRAAPALTEALDLSQISDHAHIYTGAAILLGQLRLQQGRLHEAIRIYQQARSRLTAQKQYVSVARITIALSAALCEQDKLEEAARLINTHLALVEQSGYTAMLFLGHLTQARIHWADWHIEPFQASLDLAAQIAHIRQSQTEQRIIAAWQARLWIAQGELELAMQWRAEAALSDEASTIAGHSFVYMVLIELELALAHRKAQAPALGLLYLLDRLRQQARTASRQMDAIAIQALLALTQHAQGNDVAARASIGEVLALAASQRQIRVLAEFGPALAVLILACGAGRPYAVYSQQLIAACERRSDDKTLIPGEQLSRREHEVLALIARGLTDAEIAIQLGIALGTARWHTKRILAKLGVANRTQAALLRARQVTG